MTEYTQRTEVVDYLRSVLCGPRDGLEEIVQGTPFLRYLTGILFPVGQSIDAGERSVTANAEEDAPSGDIGNEEGEQENGLELAFEMLQAAVGLSFRVPADATILCKVWAGRYVPVLDRDGARQPGHRKGRAESVWQRIALATPEAPEIVRLHRESTPVKVFSGLAHVEIRWRNHGDGTAVVTVSLVNLQRQGKKAGLDPALALFQVGLACEVADGAILPYPAVGTDHGPESEESEVAFLYKESRPFARGHGTAATWSEPTGDTSACVQTDFVPSVDVPPATFELQGTAVDKGCTDIEFLCSHSKDEILRALATLPVAYRKWIDSHREPASRGPFAEVASRFVTRADTWCDRIEHGLTLLNDDPVAWRAFQLANRAMGMQMVMAKRANEDPVPLSKAQAVAPFDFAGYKWRPFQIAFMLAAIESTWNPKSNYREMVDVIWFPTGGGKTEAYLFVSALELIRRRFIHGDSDTATAIMSRYTLRMLTAQQFQRTAALVIALELLRREDPSLGVRPFSLGLWVGKSLTPNHFRAAADLFSEKLNGPLPANPFQLQACPCCATEIFPSKPVGRPGYWNMEHFGVVATPSSFTFHCPNKLCLFHENLPVNVVDEALYQSPPSVLLGTLDKFAQLPWDRRSRSFFGGPLDASPPPSLILQDELHLISGPLGSLSAPYEAAIESIIRLRGPAPKRIASTATIRNAKDQILGLYGRNSAVFPSPCGSWQDAFFFSIDQNKPGRKYVGVMGQGYTKPIVAMTWTCAAILQAPQEVNLDSDTKDAYWTLLAYHNSRRELGRTLTAARDEIDTRIKVITSAGKQARTLREPMELSAQMVKSMSEAIDQLKRKHTEAKPGVDFVPCTSIISVGVDVSRLGVMLVNGQPKLTSEYIQASSRVGRADVPGLVVTLFSPSKPRDRSHYEDFRAYHEAIYRFVEPTSVTPYALPARERTFHAALISLIRHGLAWSKVDDAGKVDFDDPTTRDAIAGMVDRMCIADKGEAAALRDWAAKTIEEWQDFSGPDLHYESRGAQKNFRSLMYQYGELRSGALWATMNSVRNVDSETRIEVK